MAEFGRRDVVQDPLANAAGTPTRTLGLSGVGNPNQSGGQVNDGQLVNLLSGVQRVLAGELEKQRDEEITRGKMAFMGGITNASLIANGNKYTERGYETLNAANRANMFYQNELLSLENGGQEIDPTTYQKQLLERRAQELADLPEDPAVRKVYAAAFEDLAPKLVGAHMQANNTWNKGRRLNEFTNALVSTATVAGNTPQASSYRALPISGEQVSAPITVDARDRDIGIRTLLGEAANQGETSLAGVAWVLRNRVDDGSWGSTVSQVALAQQQFSAWNTKENGGNDLVSKYGPGTPQYERAAKVFDAVMGGYTVDMTGGATHYFSGSGMVASGDADGKPSWYASEKARAGGEITIGAHTFLGRIVGSTNALAASEGNTTVPAHATDAQTLIDSIQGLSNDDKATAVASAMAMSLDQGSSALWDSLGGTAGLVKLGASAQQVNQVFASHERFKTEQASKFDLEQEHQTAELLTMIADGRMDRAGAEQFIQQRYDSGELNDQQASSLVRSVYADLANIDARAYKSGGQDNPAYMDELAGLYDNMRNSSGMTVSDIAPQIAALSAKYGVDQKETDIVLGRMDALRQQRMVSDKSAIEQALVKKATEDGLKERVKQALATGGGLKDITGDISVPNENGTVSKVPAKEWGIRYLREQIAQDLRWQVKDGSLDQATAASKLDDTLYATLAKQGVVDEKFGQMLSSAGSGNIITKDGPTKESIMAFEWYQRMTQNPNVGQSYVDQMLPSGDAKMLFAQAAVMDPGRGNSADTLRKAYEVLHNPNVDLNYNPTRDVQFKIELDKQLGDTISEITGGFGQGLANVGAQFGLNTAPTWSNDDIQYLKEHDAVARLYIEKQALASYREWPAASPTAHLKIAMEAFKQNLRVIGGDMIIGPPGRNLNDDMGLVNTGPEAPQQVVKQWLMENGQKYWGKLWDDLQGSNTTLGLVLNDTTQQVPDFSVQYNFSTKRLELRLWSDNTRTQLVGDPLSLDAEALGKEFVNRSREVGFLERIGGAVTGTAANAARPLDQALKDQWDEINTRNLNIFGDPVQP